MARPNRLGKSAVADALAGSAALALADLLRVWAPEPISAFGVGFEAIIILRLADLFLWVWWHQRQRARPARYAAELPRPAPKSVLLEATTGGLIVAVARLLGSRWPDVVGWTADFIMALLALMVVAIALWTWSGLHRMRRTNR